MFQSPESFLLPARLISAWNSFALHLFTPIGLSSCRKTVNRISTVESFSFFLISSDGINRGRRTENFSFAQVLTILRDLTGNPPQLHQAVDAADSQCQIQPNLAIIFDV